MSCRHALQSTPKAFQSPCVCAKMRHLVLKASFLPHVLQSFVSGNSSTKLEGKERVLLPVANLSFARNAMPTAHDGSRYSHQLTWTYMQNSKSRPVCCGHRRLKKKPPPVLHIGKTLSTPHATDVVVDQMARHRGLHSASDDVRILVGKTAQDKVRCYPVSRPFVG